MININLKLKKNYGVNSKNTEEVATRLNVYKKALNNNKLKLDQLNLIIDQK